MPQSSKVCLPSSGSESLFPWITGIVACVFLISFSRMTVHSPRTGRSSVRVFNRQIFRFGAFLISSFNCYLSMIFASVPVSGSTSTFAPFLEILQLFFLALGCAVQCTSMCCIIRAISLLLEIDLLSELLYVLSELSSWCPCRTWRTRLRQFCLWHDFPALRDLCDVTLSVSSWRLDFSLLSSMWY